ncbi:MAG: hypothetical protein M3N42_06665, partial [Cyanobacteriota bacterium]|nr:hypothetical protein [Cyanobacteriota bacterium]
LNYITFGDRAIADSLHYVPPNRVGNKLQLALGIAEGRRKKEEARRKKQEGRRKKQEGRSKKEEARRKKQ